MLRIPIFFAHLHEHRQENPGISLERFVILHYFSGDVRDKDYERDMELPFKSHEPAAYFSPVPLPPLQPQLTIVTHRQVAVVYPDYINKLHPFIYHPDIFEPPRPVVC
ncbi:hypothetical protein [Chitinophaga japonensis]|uniref:hypothetical protein n=1 Tax=Chitinophaga japonensis TaxID=104662 RepID=UPI0011AABA17|nr:hypothetical protein [Chitinophaga japonensis]